MGSSTARTSPLQPTACRSWYPARRVTPHGDGAPGGTRGPNLPLTRRTLCRLSYWCEMERVTGVEPADSGLADRRLTPRLHPRDRGADDPSAACAYTRRSGLHVLSPHALTPVASAVRFDEVVGTAGFEPTTSGPPDRRATQTAPRPDEVAAAGFEPASMPGYEPGAFPSATQRRDWGDRIRTCNLPVPKAGVLPIELRPVR